MIYTVTFNPSLDYIVGVDDFRLGATNRTSYEQMLAGGKGKMCIRDRLYQLHSWYRRIIVLSRIVRYDDCGW